MLKTVIDRDSHSVVIESEDEFISLLNKGEIAIFQLDREHILTYKERNKYKMHYVEDNLPIKVMNIRGCYQELIKGCMGKPFVNKGLRMEKIKVRVV